MTVKGKFTCDIPEHQAFLFRYVEVAGVFNCIENAKQFILGRDHGIELVPEPDNEYDPNAIAVYGHSKGWFFRRRKKLGYIPADLAATIAKRGLTPYVLGYPASVWLGGYVKDVAYINIDIVAPAVMLKGSVKSRKKKSKGDVSDTRKADEVEPTGD